MEDRQIALCVRTKDTNGIITLIGDGTTGTLSIYDAKANWKRNTRAWVPKLLKKWREKKDGQRYGLGSRSQPPQRRGQSDVQMSKQLIDKPAA